jgi:Ca2+-binding RTX toxin-like protein
VLDGGAGNDVINAGTGNATLAGGTGNDTINACYGIDTFVFNHGDGQDVINEVYYSYKSAGKNQDVLQLGAGLLASATQVTRRASTNDLTLLFGGGDQITLTNYFDSSYRIQTIQFADGTKWDYSSVASKVIYNGTAGNDSLIGLWDMSNTINGGAGNDTITGGTQTDVLDGGAGNDVINAGNGNALLIGGTGNDTINAGYGIDTFVFNQGDGQDVINEAYSSYKTGGKNLDVLQLGAGLQAAATQVVRGAGTNDLTLVFGGGDQIKLTNYFDSSYRMQTIQFADGTKWDYSTVASKVIYNGTAGNDYLTGLWDMSNIINGGAGNDTITGGSQTDVLDGGAGNDVINAGSGNATLTGGTGNDTINAGYGIDTFVFNQGYGQDVINEAYYSYKTGGKNQDVLQLGAGLQAAATQVVRGAGTNDLTLVFGGGDQIKLTNYFDSAYRMQTIQFADGTRWDYTSVAGKLIYNGTAGNDYLTGLSDMSNTINGGAGNDTITGGGQTDLLDGGAGNDVINAGSGNATLAGGTGNDTINAGYGIDTFVFNQGDGQDVINETYSSYKTGGKNQDVLQLGAGLVASATQVTRGAGTNDLTLVFGGGDQIKLTNYFNSAYRMQTIQFADGTKWDYASVASKLVYNGTAGNDTLTGLTDMSNTINGGAGNDTITGGGQTDVLDGGAGNDVINAGSGNATLTGGTGNDTINAGYGIDTFVFNQGDGQDVINETYSSYKTGGKNQDVLQLGAGLVASATQVTRGAGTNDLTLVFGGGDQIKLTNYFNSAYRMQTIQFADGTKWDYASVAGKLIYNGTAGNDTLTGLTDMSNTINGGAGNDTITGGSQTDVLAGGTGNDSLNGGVGNDTYLFNVGDGLDVISDYDTAAGNIDKLQLGAGVTPDIVQLNRTTYDLIVSINANDKVTLQNYFYSSAYRVETIAFADGSTWDVQTTLNKLISGTAGNDNLSAVVGYTNRIDGGAGNDTINGADKDDYLSGSDGSDYLNGNIGNDVLQGGAGTDTLSDSSGNNLFDGGSEADSITGGAGNEFFAGGKGNDTITTGAGADLIAFNRGDGMDAVNASSGKDNTLSLGGGITYADLLFTKSGNDLILSTAATDQIRLKDWYANVNNHSVSTLQMVIEGTTDYDAASSSALNNKKIEQFNFDGLVTQFDQARTANPALTSWALSSALMNFYLDGSDTSAMGGDLAYQYARTGSVSSLSIVPAQALLSSAQFGVSNQALQSASALQDLSPRLS